MRIPSIAVVLRTDRSLPLAAVVGSLFVFASVTIAADADQERLEELQRNIVEDQARAARFEEEARALREEIAALRQETIEVARRNQDLEEELSDIESTLEALQAEEAERLVDLRGRRAQLTGTLAALQRIAAQPPEALIAAPGSPLETVRSAMLLRVAVPAIEDRAELLRVQLQDLALVRGQIASEQADLHAAAATLDGERRRLGGLIARKQQLEQSALAGRSAARDRAQRLASEAEDLRDLLERLERQALRQQDRLARDRALREAHLAAMRAERAARGAEAESETRALAEREDEPSREASPSPAQVIELAKPINVRAFPRAPSGTALVLPARGRLVGGYGERLGDDDSVSKGLTIETRSSSQVVAPYDGKVVYAGLFRGYGQILIIEHGGRYHSLLAGLDRIDAVVGQWVLAGEPLGAMNDTVGGKPRLYMELRRTGQPINPLPWLAANFDKVQG